MAAFRRSLPRSYDARRVQRRSGSVRKSAARRILGSSLSERAVVTPAEKRQRLRAVLAGPVCISPATVFDALSARVAQSVGYEIAVLSGSVSYNPLQSSGSSRPVAGDASTYLASVMAHSACQLGETFDATSCVGLAGMLRHWIGGPALGELPWKRFLFRRASSP